MLDPAEAAAKIEALQSEVSALRRRVNHYDADDVIRCEAKLLAGPVRLACYRVRDPETQQYGGRQFHMTFDNMVVAVAGEEAAKLFARFVTDTLRTHEG